MQILIASGLLLGLGAYLVYQFWARALAGSDEAPASGDASAEASPGREADRTEELDARQKARPKAA